MTYKIAIGTSDGKNIDLHFGQLNSISIFEVNESDGTYSFLESRKIERYQKKEAAETGCSCGTEKIGKLINDCTYLLVAKIGNKPYRILQENNVNCIEAPFEMNEAVSKLNDYYILHKHREVHIF